MAGNPTFRDLGEQASRDFEEPIISMLLPVLKKQGVSTDYNTLSDAIQQCLKWSAMEAIGFPVADTSIEKWIENYKRESIARPK